MELCQVLEKYLDSCLLDDLVPQWLRIYYRVIKYYIRIHISAPLLVTEALTLLKNTPNIKKNWNASICEIIRKYTLTHNVDPSGIRLGGVKKNLYITSWKEELWNDTHLKRTLDGSIILIHANTKR